MSTIACFYQFLMLMNFEYFSCAKLSVYNLLKRYDWRKLSPRLIPKPIKTSQKTFKKNFSKLLAQIMKQRAREGSKVVIAAQEEDALGRINTLNKCWCVKTA